MSSIPQRHQKQYQQRIRRVRAVVVGTNERPRLAVFCGNRSTSAQLIDDAVGRTLASATDHGHVKRGTVASATDVGRALAQAAGAKQITTAVLDRRGRAYHGRVKALAQAAREAGLSI